MDELVKTDLVATFIEYLMEFYETYHKEPDCLFISPMAYEIMCSPEPVDINELEDRGLNFETLSGLEMHPDPTLIKRRVIFYSSTNLEKGILH